MTYQVKFDYKLEKKIKQLADRKQNGARSREIS